MSALKESILQKLDTLPDPALRQVLDFMSFLSWKGEGDGGSVLAAAGRLAGEPMSAAQIEEALYGPDRREPR